MTHDEYVERRRRLIETICLSSRKACEAEIEWHQNLMAKGLEKLEKEFVDDYWRRFIAYCHTGKLMASTDSLIIDATNRESTYAHEVDNLVLELRSFVND